jgi:hypothetical protein
VNTSGSYLKHTDGEAPDVPGTPIFGSVSPADIVQEIRASVAHNPEAATIMLNERSVTIDGIEENRIKALGSYDVSVVLRDDKVFKRRIHVKPVLTIDTKAKVQNQAIDSLTSEPPQIRKYDGVAGERS